MEALTDAMIAGALEFKKNKIWNTLKGDNLIALTFVDGTVGYIHVFCPKGDGYGSLGIRGFALYRADELYGYRFMVHRPIGMSEVEAQVQWSLRSCIELHFAPKDRASPVFVEAIRLYRAEMGLRSTGKNAFFEIFRYVPHLTPQCLTDPKDRTHTEETLDFLNWLSCHGGGERLPAFNDGIPCFTACTGTYRMAKVELPPIKEYEFPKVPFPNEVLAHRLKSAGKRGILDCNLVTLPTMVMDGEDEIPCYPWGLLACPEDEEYTMEPYIYRRFDEKMVEALAETFVRLGFVPREIHVINERTGNLLEDFCRKTGIHLAMGKSRKVIEDLSNEFFYYMDPANLDYEEDSDFSGEEDDARDPDLLEIIHKLTLMSDDMIQSMPDFIQQAVKIRSDELPKSLRKRLSRLWGWKRQS